MSQAVFSIADVIAVLDATDDPEALKLAWQWLDYLTLRGHGAYLLRHAERRDAYTDHGTLRCVKVSSAKAAEVSK